MGHKNQQLSSEDIKEDNQPLENSFITIDRHAALALKESEERFRAMADSSPMATFIIDPNIEANVSYWNKTWLEYTGQSLTEAKDLAWNNVIHPDDISVVMDIYVPAFNNQQPYVIPAIRVKRFDGVYRWHMFKGNPRYLPNGEFIGYIGVGFDIHESRIASIALKKSEAFNRSILDSSPDCIKLLDIEGRLQFMNSNGICLMEIDDFNTLKNNCWWDMWEENNQPMVKRAVAKAAAGEKVQFQAYSPTLKGTYKWWDVIVQPLEMDTDTGKIQGILCVSRDITKYREATLKVEESEHKFSTLADNIENLAWIADGNGWIYWYNKRWFDYTGTTLEEMQGWGWQKVHHPDHVQRVLGLIKELWHKNEPFELIFPLRRYDGVYRWFLTRGRPTADENGNVIQWFGTNTDITEQKETQSLLEYRKALLEAHNESSLDGLLLVDTKGKILSYNKRFVQIWNMPQHITDASDDEAALNFAMEQLVRPQQFIEKVQWLYNHPADTSLDELEFKNGKIIERHGYPVVGENGGYYAWSWTFKDITEAKQAELSLRRSEENFRQLADLIPQKISSADGAGAVYYYNQSWLDYTGMGLQQLQQHGWADCMHPDEVAPISEQWIKSVKTGNDFEVELQLKDKEGNYKWHLSRAVAVKDENGKTVKWIGSMTEIQKIKEDEKRKDVFLTMVSHELKTPVTSIKGYVQVLLMMLSETKETTPVLKPITSSLKRIDIQISRLTRLITEMLDMSRIESGKLEMQKSQFYLNGLVEETIRDVSQTNTTHNINLQDDCQCIVTGDRDRLGQVLINFINNAIKYSPENNLVNVHIFKPSPLQAAVSVQDFGIGISAEEQSKIFERFYRVEGKKEATFSGFGIGLFIANEIIERHNGTIQVESGAANGTVFTFTIPLSS